jgi:hypothetical protein
MSTTTEKPAKSAKPAAHPVIAALASASNAVKNLPAAPTFNGDALHKSFLDAGLPEDFAKRAVEESKRKFEAIHGNTGEAVARAVIHSIADSLGGLEEFARLASRLASDARAAGKVTVTGKDWEACAKEGKEAKPEHKTLFAKARELYREGKAWSEIETVLNLAPASRQQLYLVARETPALFPARK